MQTLWNRSELRQTLHQGGGKGVAGNTDTSEEAVATRFWRRVGVDILRANCRAFHRRLVGKISGEGPKFEHFAGLGLLEVAEGF